MIRRLRSLLLALLAISSLGAVLGLGRVKEREAYEALDWLIERQMRIENGLARRHQKTARLVVQSARRQSQPRWHV